MTRWIYGWKKGNRFTRTSFLFEWNCLSSLFMGTWEVQLLLILVVLDELVSYRSRDDHLHAEMGLCIWLPAFVSVYVGVNTLALFLQSCSLSICVCACVWVCKWFSGSVGTFIVFGRIWLFCAIGHSFWQSGHKVLSVVGVHDMAHAAAFLFITHALAPSLIHLRGLLGQTNLINIRVWNAFQYWKNLENIWFNFAWHSESFNITGDSGLSH